MACQHSSDSNLNSVSLISNSQGHNCKMWNHHSVQNFFHLKQDINVSNKHGKLEIRKLPMTLQEECLITIFSMFRVPMAHYEHLHLNLDYDFVFSNCVLGYKKLKK